jgi:hypothetical protein
MLPKQFVVSARFLRVLAWRHFHELSYRDSDLRSARPTGTRLTQVIDHLDRNAMVRPCGTLMAKGEHATAQ